MGIVIDSSILIAAERRRLDIARHVAGREDQEFYLSVVSASELLHGIWRATTPDVRAKRTAFVEDVLQKFPILPIDLGTARLHAQVWADLEKAGQSLAAHDLWIAASCLAHRHILATADVRHFRRVPGLLLEQWAVESAPAAG